MLADVKFTIMKEEIELRDYFAAHVMSGKVQDFFAQTYRKNIAKKKELEEWIVVSSEEATIERIETAAELAYMIADALLEARKK